MAYGCYLQRATPTEAAHKGGAPAPRPGRQVPVIEDLMNDELARNHKALL
jgi:hypothetical protein